MNRGATFLKLRLKTFSPTFIGLGLSASIFSAGAQPLNAPRIGYVYPAGGRPGATVQIVVGGQFLRAVTNGYLSGGIGRATFVEYNRPLTQKEFNDLRDEFRALQEKKRIAGQKDPGTTIWAAADQSRLTEIRERILKNPPNRQGNPAIAETVTLQITLAPNAAPGEHEIRVATPGALSNPLFFWVNTLPEYSKPLAKAPNPEINFLRQPGPDRNPSPAPPQTETRVTLPATVNGQIMPGAKDRFRFAARKGEQLVVSVSARRLIPYLADAVPGWFQAAVTLYDSKEKELAYEDDYRFHPDPLLRFEIPRDGEYSIEIQDALYRGREDFVYRITLGALPLVTSIFPLGGPAGADTEIQLNGCNLATNQIVVKNEKPGIHRPDCGNDPNEHHPFAVDELPEVLEQETNDSVFAAQLIQSPVIVNGRINFGGDADLFRFEGNAGGDIVAETYARRLNSPLDSQLTLSDEQGRILAANDDHEDKGAGLDTHHADSWLRAKLPAKGTYYLRVEDVQKHGGQEYAYRLRLSPPRPDFELRVVPSSINVRAGASAPLTVYALRRDGFSGEITLRLKDSPLGFVMGGARIPAGQNHVLLTLAGPQNPQPEPVTLSVEGRALIQGKEVVRTAIPAEDRMQAFAYRHLVPAKELKALVSQRGSFVTRMKLLTDAPIRIPLDGGVQVRLGPAPAAFVENFQLELNEPPDGISLKEIMPLAGAIVMVLQCDGAKARPGLEGNLIVNLFQRNNAPANGNKFAGNNRRVAIGVLPAIPFEVIRSP